MPLGTPEWELMKADLKEAGLWSSFVEIRDRYKNENGLRPVDAKERALDDLNFPPRDIVAAPVAPPVGPSQPFPQPLPEFHPPPSSSAAGVFGGDHGVVPPSPGRAAGSDYGYGESTFPILPEEPVAAELAILAETMNEFDVLRWVFENMNTDLDEAEKVAPSKGALGLLKNVRADVTAKRFFYTQMWAKLLNAKNLEENDTALQEEADAICAALDKIEGHSAAAFAYSGRN